MRPLLCVLTGAIFLTALYARAESLSLTCSGKGSMGGSVSTQLELNSNGSVVIDGSKLAWQQFAWAANVISFSVNTTGTPGLYNGTYTKWSINRINGLLNIADSNGMLETTSSLICHKSTAAQRQF